MQKKTWRQPELIILTRNNPEEVVLTNCKKSGGGGADNYRSHCYTNNGIPCGPLRECGDLGSS